jgi:hypothetical protein
MRRGPHSWTFLIGRRKWIWGGERRLGTEKNKRWIGSILLSAHVPNNVL